MTPLFSIPFAIIALETLVKDNFLLEKSYSILILIDTKAFHGESHFFSLKKTAFFLQKVIFLLLFQVHFILKDSYNIILAPLRKEKSHTIFLNFPQYRSTLNRTYSAIQFNTYWLLAFYVPDILAGTEVIPMTNTQFMLSKSEDDRQFQH